MYCTECGVKILAADKFCTSCGAENTVELLKAPAAIKLFNSDSQSIGNVKVAGNNIKLILSAVKDKIYIRKRLFAIPLALCAILMMAYSVKIIVSSRSLSSNMPEISAVKPETTGDRGVQQQTNETANGNETAAGDKYGTAGMAASSEKLGTDMSWYSIQDFTYDCKIDEQGPSGFIQMLQTARQSYKIGNERKIENTAVEVTIELTDMGKAITLYRGRNRCEAAVNKIKGAKNADVDRFK